MTDRIERALESEMSILESQLQDGSISNNEYNEQMRDLERDAREQYREECDSMYEEWMGRH